MVKFEGELRDLAGMKEERQPDYFLFASSYSHDIGVECGGCPIKKESSEFFSYFILLLYITTKKAVCERESIVKGR